MKILFTGGHHNSALAVIDSLQQKCQKSQPEADQPMAEKPKIIWIGHKYSMLGDKEVSAEYKEVTAKKIPFHNLKAGKFYRTRNIIQLLRIPLGFVQAFYLLIKIRPTLIVSFGGYLAVPVVVAGFFLGIPSVTHEQTVVTGIANKIVAKFAQRIMLSWKSSSKYFPEDKSILTGLPLRKELFSNKRINFKNDLPVIYITGGKQGSHIINQQVSDTLEQLLGLANIIHQCGSSTLHHDYQELTKLRKTLSNSLRERYRVKDYFGSNEIGSILNSADLVVGRSGAHTIYELAALGKAALLIPLPSSSHDEQDENAKILKRVGQGEILSQEDLNADVFYNRIKAMIKNQSRYRGKKVEVILDGDKRVANEIIKTLKKIT